METTTWTFLTNHAHVLLCINADHSMRLREVAERVGITERAAQRIVADLCESGYLTRRRVGRRNQYDVHPELPMRHPVEHTRQVGALLSLLESNP
jgi:DNA-binding IclR family transcriptional regulator